MAVMQAPEVKIIFPKKRVKKRPKAKKPGKPAPFVIRIPLPRLRLAPIRLPVKKK